MSPVAAVPPRPLLARTLAANAFLLSALYLLLGLVLEAVRRVGVWPGAARLLLAMDALPARVLNAFGLLLPLREAYLSERLSAGALRAVFAVTTTGVIFVTAALVGVVMSLLALLLPRRRAE